MIIIGEKINGTRKDVQQAVINRDSKYIEKLAVDQVECGATIIDLNAGTKSDREPDDLIWLAKIVQEVTDKTLCLDSPNPKALTAALKAVDKPPMINSISGEAERLEGILPIVAENDLEVVALAMDSKGIPKGVEDRMGVVRRLFEECRKAGIADSKVYVDPLITTISSDISSGNIALETMKAIRNEFPKAHLTGGMSNISFGMPLRSVINRAFMTLAIYIGLDSAIIDPTDRELMTALLAAEVVSGKDAFCMNFNRSFRAGKIGPVPTK